MKRLSRQLLNKSQEAFLLSLEIYNKPTIQYRLESFCFFFTNAWELLLKAYLLEGTKSEKSIFYPKEKNKPRKSITLRDALKRIFTNEKDPVRKNVEGIADLRDSATHLVVSELETIYVGLFQAGVLNYLEKLKEWFGVNVADKISPAMLSLIFDIGKVNPILLRKKHGREIADFFANKSNEIEGNISTLSDKKYCISVEYKLALVKNPKDADITLSAGPQGKFSGTVIEIPKDPSLTYPYRQIDCINQVKAKIAQGIVFNSYDFQAILHKDKIRGNNKYHYCYKAFGSNSYSPELIDYIVNKINSNQNYLVDARAWFKQNPPKKKGKSA